MADKYSDKAPQPGICQQVDGVNIRIAAGDSIHRSGRKGTRLVEVGSEQVPCPNVDRCGSCIVDSVLGKENHPTWYEVARTGQEAEQI